MSRRPRIVVPELPHHVTQRGNYQQIVFEEEIDYRRYAYLYAKNVHKYGVRTVAYCLMANHVHFIVIPLAKDSLARLFNNVHMQYSQYVNKKHNKKGHLWQARFFSCVMSWGHFYQAVRYVEQNPVRAGSVPKAWGYPWSSAKQHVGSDAEPIIKAEPSGQIMEDFNFGNRDGWKEYLEENDDKVIAEIRASTRKGLILGPKEFIRNVESTLGINLSDIKVGRPKRK